MIAGLDAARGGWSRGSYTMRMRGVLTSCRNLKGRGPSPVIESRLRVEEREWENERLEGRPASRWGGENLDVGV